MAKKSKRKSGSRKFKYSGFFSKFIHGFGVFLFFTSKFFPILLVGVLIGVIYHGIQNYLYADPYFRLDRIRVKTDLPFSTNEVEKMSNLKLGQNLLSVDITEVARRIERNPEIKRAEVKRVLPNTIEIDVIRRFEVFQIKLDGRTQYYAIDDQGTVLPKSGSNPLRGLVLIQDTGVPGKAFGVGDIYPSKNLKNFKLLYQYLLQESELSNEKIEALYADHLGNFTVFLTGGFEVRLGKAYVKNLKKLRGLTNLLKSKEREKIEYLDLQYQDVVVKMKQNEQLKM